MQCFPAIDGRRPLERCCLGLLSLFWLAGCAAEVPSKDAGETKAAATTGTSVLRLATTTSLRDSGLLERLLPAFEQAHDCRVDVIAVGTGAALKLGEAGDADVLLVHARSSEEAFMQAGHGTRHEEFAYNEFVILGPPEDPARIRGAPPARALKSIAAANQRYLSRGDDSGTHQRELSLWKSAGGRPVWDGYVETGQGMGPTLIMADEMRGYTLADAGTYLTLKDKIELIPLTTRSESLRNPYAAIVVDSRKSERMNPQLADALVDYLISPGAQRLIGDYRVAGRQLFRPTRIPHDDE